MILAALLLAFATPRGDTLAPRFQGAFALVEGKDLAPRVVLGFRETGSAPGRLVAYGLGEGKVLFDCGVGSQCVNYGRRMSAILDLDGDGCPDLAVACARKDGARDIPQVELRSGRDGRLLGMLEAQIDEIGFGECVAALPDIDGDGKAEFVVGATMKSPLRPGLFAAYAVYSGATRERLGRVMTEAASGLMQGAFVPLHGPKDHPRAAHSTGRSVLRMDLGAQVLEASFTLEDLDAATQVVGIANAGDLDGDGDEELLVAENSSGAHAWVLLDGKTWKPRALPTTAAAPAGPLAWLARIDDLDGDGTADFLGAQSFATEELLYAFSGKSLAILRTLAVPAGKAPFFGGACMLVRAQGLAPFVLAACLDPQGRGQERGVYCFDWDKRVLVRVFGQ
ncbi:MAG: VCBS repeat-containing protein [Planctomycetes bacterium]|nr:VCBS repeat-containing protein [Planctomycetota bacterium]